jgi:hypothetical protein
MFYAVAAAVVGVVGNAYVSNKNAKKAAQSVSDQNAANAALHTMTPEEKASYFSQGVTKVNDASISSQGLLDRNLAARGLGGNAVAAPNANLQRSRIKSIADIWNNLTNKAMDMKAGTPPVAAVPPVPSFGMNLLGSFSNAIGGAAAPIAGQKLGAMFG